jgi:hypothetical protein
MKDEVSKLKRGIRGAKRPYPNAPYPTSLREKAITYITEQRTAGASWCRIADELGISLATVMQWHAKAQSSKGPRRGGAFVPVQVRDDTKDERSRDNGLVLTTPEGYRLEGLEAADAAVVLRALR